MGGSVRADAYWQAKSEDGRTCERRVRTELNVCSVVAVYHNLLVSEVGQSADCAGVSMRLPPSGPNPKEVTTQSEEVDRRCRGRTTRKRF